MNETSIPLKDSDDIIVARQTARSRASELNFSIGEQTRLATAVSELVRNAIQYAGSGVCRITYGRDGGRPTVQVIVEDNGPGITNLEKALQDGFSTSRGRGAGLPGARRLVDEFAIESNPGHTKVTIALVQATAQ